MLLLVLLTVFSVIVRGHMTLGRHLSMTNQMHDTTQDGSFNLITLREDQIIVSELLGYH